MFSPRIRYAADDASGGVQEKVQSLTDRIKAEPNNELPLLELAHLYAQIWIRNPQPEILQRVLVCLGRAATLENGTYAPQLAKLLEGVSQHVRDRGLAEPLAKLEAISRRLAQRPGGPGPAPQPEPTPAPTTPDPSAPPTQSTPAAMEMPPPETETSADSEDTPLPEVEIEPTPPATPPPQRESAPLPEPLAEPEADSTPLEPEMRAPSGLPPETPIESTPVTTPPAGMPRTPLPSSAGLDMEVHTVEAEFAPDRRRFVRDMAATNAASLRDVQQLFREERLNDILRAYTTLSDIRTKRRIIEGLVERIPKWRIEPVLALGALETDEQLFRFIMRLLLRGDRSEICKQINLSTYSPDLQKVAVIVLSELGVRSALAKLEKALQLNDPIVRTVAAHGIARAGRAAAAYIPKLIETVVSDPNLEVRRSAAKALNTMGIKEAYQALEDAAGKHRFDAEIYTELEEMREVFGSGRRSTAKAPPGKTKAAGRGGMTPQQKQNMIKAAVILVVILAALAFGYKQFKQYLPGPAPPVEQYPE
ncbi:HEAT repeat domain-containing protein [Candidatus Sumerlaeota bacterium]|nr:HEAT repeat domain-containing protein [Candidatus Sumerlaeota bacterium]